MRGTDLSELEATIAALSEPDRTALAETLKEELEQPFIPNTGPQQEALESEADILLYGGQAGGGKSALEIGAFFRDHHDGIVLRREAVQLDGLIAFCKEVGEPNHGHYVAGNENVFKRNDGGRLKFAGLNQADDWRKHAGIARDFMAFDEAGEFLEEQVASLIGWLRSTRPGQRCRVILGSNPPRGGDGEWLLKWFAPWLDPLFPDPAMPGELRWAVRIGDEIVWVEGPGIYEDEDGEEREAQSYTFIPASLDDNPYLKDTAYRRTLQNLPEPLRSQLLYGDFTAGREDHEWQIVPTAWVDAAQRRWRDAAQKRRQMLAVSADVALGGADDLIIGSLHVENWFGEFEAARGVDITKPSEIAKRMMARRKDSADMSVDYTGGWGSGVKSHLEEDHSVYCTGIVFSEGSAGRTYDGRFGFKNKRAEMIWRFREALDPEGGQDEKIMLPPDPKLKAEITAWRWKLVGTDILVESKDEIRKRIGSSTDRADTAVMLWSRRDEAVMRAVASKGGMPVGGWTSAAPDEGLSW